MALNSEGLPLGLELDAAAGRDRDLLALARRVEHVIGRVPGPTGFEAAGTPDVRAAALLGQQGERVQRALSGDWTVGKQATVLNEANGRIACGFHARDLHLVMGPAARGTSVRCRVLIDGQPPGAAHGIDVDRHGNGTVAEQRLYQLIRQPKPITDRQFEIEFFGSGVEVFALTFG